MFELGPHEKSLAQQAYRAGQPLPDRIANAPELRLGLQLFMQGFFDLDTERSHGNGLTPIPFSKVMEYADRFGMEDEQADRFWFCIRSVDTTHLARMAAKQKAEVDANARRSKFTRGVR